MAADADAPFRGLRPLFGDLHNHCDISYGRGSLDEAYANARLQLDFASVTGHAHWPDMPPREGRLAYLVDYHQRGFDRLASLWDWVQERTEAHHEDGRFATFLSFEWHSMRHGDYCIYYDGPRGEIVRAPDIEAMRTALAQVRAGGGRAMMIPHHICYVPGFRGVHWPDFDARFSPVVEIVSMHGCAEHDDAPRPYLHSMGPRDGRGSMLAGLRAGHRFGVIGSTDHHAAHPGSHGHGLLGVWAEGAHRDAIWRALEARRTWALTGDRVELAFSCNGAPMGAELPAVAERRFAADVRAGGPIDYLELVKNGVALARRDALGLPAPATPRFRGRVVLSVGWGEPGEPCDWRVRLGVRGGRLLGVEPRLRADEGIAGRFGFDGTYHFSRVERSRVERSRVEGSRIERSRVERSRVERSGVERSRVEGEDELVTLETRTWKNPTTTSDSTQKVALELEGDGETRLVADVNGRSVDVPLRELREGPRAGFLDGFVSQAWQLSRAVPEEEYAWSWRVDDVDPGGGPDVYLLRVRQKNDQWAWSSPVFVG